MGKTLILFLKNGKTVKFSNVTNFETHTSGLMTFTYVSASDGETRVAIFDSNSFVGYSVSVTPEREDVSKDDKSLKGENK